MACWGSALGTVPRADEKCALGSWCPGRPVVSYVCLVQVQLSLLLLCGFWLIGSLLGQGVPGPLLGPDSLSLPLLL